MTVSRADTIWQRVGCFDKVRMRMQPGTGELARGKRLLAGLQRRFFTVVTFPLYTNLVVTNMRSRLGVNAHVMHVSVCARGKYTVIYTCIVWGNAFIDQPRGYITT